MIIMQNYLISKNSIYLKIIIILLIVPFRGFAQKNDSFEKIIPKITRYTRTDFEADGQFWTMTEDEDGILYFGNNDGILIYDGERWQKVALPNHSTVRSLIKDKNNVIHAGGYNEIGIVKKKSNGTYYYLSQNDDLEIESENLENFWQVHEFKNTIIYRSFSELTVLSNKNTSHIKANGNFLHSGIVNTHYYVQDQNTGIFEFDPESFSLQKQFDTSIINSSIVAFLPSKTIDEVLIVTKSGELFLANRSTHQLQFLKSLFSRDEQEQIITATFFKGDYLLGTLSSKILKLNRDFDIEPNHATFDKLSNSTVLAIYPQEKNNRLWVLMNNGIDLVEFDSPVSQLFDNSSIADMHIYKNILYLATNTGVYYAPFKTEDFTIKDLRFKKIPDLEGQAWSITEENGDVLVGHDKGLFRLNNFQPERIGSTNGIWKIVPLKGYTAQYLAAGYSGLYPLKYNGKWQLDEKIKGFDESSRDILQIGSTNNLWICHGYKGVYKLKLDDRLDRVYALEHYTDQNGLQSSFNVNVALYNDVIVFTTNTGIYTFNEETSKFTPYKPLNVLLNPKLNTRKLLQQDSRVWFVQDDEVGYFDTDNKNKELQKNLFLNLKGNLNRGMESILPLTDQRVLIGATNGVFLYDLEEKAAEAAKTKITRVYLQGKNQTTSFLSLENNEQLPNAVDVLRFEFAAPGLTPSSQKEFQYKLEGIDTDWSVWSTNPFKEYTHPNGGDYTFKVRARNYMGQAAEETSLSFTIPHPWYQTNLAYLVYILILFVITFIIIKLVNKKIEKERQKEKLAAHKSKKLLELEIEQLKLEKDKARIKKDKEQLEEDNLIKSKELANYTMLLVKKKEIFTDTFNALKDFRNSLKTQAARKRLQEVLFNLNQHRMGEEYLNVFDVHFEKVHQNFFNQLKEIDPSITKRELRLCAFVKMNLTNKEIAPLLNISTRGVETARYRIRKKLNINDESFNAYLENLAETQSIN
ncbi:helix-turn-helix and ligand-binding sensor domain-containing protein [Leeuwenhoekiella aestuarii]|uniref:Regulatory LuxR family protein n=1 Tax=Leeuwenhoekiella aestuarii TaxID=2249426 RepID=A0A4Q0NYP4_9FLAO|nr:triple tyrosine motif-containing protein [Leeuwenhoekiella aestuarii]RXG18024.1 regulatory LuxR family protein [Leeuwenhoekiella aestuarii]